MDDMASATSKAASMAAQTGVSVDELSAMIGTMESRTKAGGDKVGTSLKSLLMNLQDVSSKKIRDTLDKAGASMTKMVNGVEKIRDPIEILEDLAKTYNSLSEADPLKSEILANIGKKMHANSLSALLTGWNDYKEMLQDFSEGTGSAAVEAQKSANNWEGRTNQLKNSFTDFVKNFTDSDVIKGGLGAANTALKGLDWISEKIGVFTTVGATKGIYDSIKGNGAFSVDKDGKISFNGASLFGGIGKSSHKVKNVLDENGFNKLISDYEKIDQSSSDAKKSTKDFWNQQKQDSNGADLIADKVKNGAASFKDYQDAVNAANESAGQFNLKSTAKNLGKAALSTVGNIALDAGIGLIAEGVMSAINYAINYSDIMIEKGQKAKTEIDNINAGYQENAALVKNSAGRYSELAKGVENTGSSIKNLTLSSSEFSEFLSLSNQFAKAFPTLVSGYDSEGNAILKLGDNAGQTSQKLQGLLDQQRSVANLQIAEKLPEQFKGVQEEVKQIDKDIAKYQSTYQAASKDSKQLELFNFENGKKGAEEFASQTEFAVDTSVKGANKIQKAVAEALSKQKDMFGSQRSAAELMYRGQNADGSEFFGINMAPYTEEARKAAYKEAESQINKYAEDTATLANQSLQQIAYQQNLKKAKWAELMPSVQSLMETLPGYTNLNEATKSGITQMLTARGFDGIDDPSEFINDEIIAPIQAAQRNPELRKAFDDLFKLESDKSSMSMQDYVDQRDQALNKISAGTGKTVESLKKSYGYLEEDGMGGYRDTYKTQLEAIQEGIGDTTDKTKKYLNSLTGEDFEIAYDLILNDDGAINSVKKLKEAIEETKQAAQESAQNDPDEYFNAWQTATETANEGAKYNSMLSGYEAAKEAYKNGEVGTDDFKTFAAMISPTGSDDARNFAENYPKFERYFQDGKAGIDNFLNDLSTLQTTTGEQMASLGDDGNWDFNVTDIDDVAQKLGVGSEMVGALFGRLRDFGIDNSVITSAEEGGTRIGELLSNLESENDRLNKLTSTTGENEQGYQTDAGDHTFGNQTSIDESRAKIEQYNQGISDTIKNTEDLIDTQNDSAESRKAAAIAAVKAMNDEKKAAERAGLSEAADTIGKEMQRFGDKYGFDAEVEANWDNDKKSEDVMDSINSKWNLLKEDKSLSDNAFKGIANDIQEIASHGGDIGALVNNFNDLAEGANSMQRMDSLGNIFDFSEESKGIASLAQNIQKTVDSGGKAEEQFTSMENSIGKLADAGIDVTKYAGMYNDLAEEAGRNKRMEYNGEVVSKDEYSGDTPKVEVSSRKLADNIDKAAQSSEQVAQSTSKTAEVSENTQTRKMGVNPVEGLMSLGGGILSGFGLLGSFLGGTTASAATLPENMKIAPTSPMLKGSNIQDVFTMAGIGEITTGSETFARNMERASQSASQVEQSTSNTATSTENAAQFTSDIDKGYGDISQSFDDYAKRSADIPETSGKISFESSDPNDIAEVAGKLSELDGKTATATLDTEVSGESELEQATSELDAADGRTATQLLESIANGIDQIVEATTAVDSADGKTATQTLESQANGTESITQATSELEAVPESKTSILDVVANNTGEVSSITSEIEAVPESKSVQIEAEVTEPDTSGIENAASTIESLSDKSVSVTFVVTGKADIESAKQALESINDKNVKLSINGSSSKKVASVKAALNGVSDKNVSVSVSVSGLSDVQSLKDAITNIQSTSADVSVNVQGSGEINTLKDSLESLNGKSVTVNVVANGDGMVTALKFAIDSVQPKTVQVTAIVKGTSEVWGLVSAINSVQGKSVVVSASTSGTDGVRSLAGAIAGVQSKTVNIVAHYSSTGSTAPTGGVIVNGTAHALGTIPKLSSRALAMGSLEEDVTHRNEMKALASGDWRTKKSETALVGELGRELVVTGNRFYTVGDNGAEFARIPAGSIVFNHIQTEEIFRNGYVTSGGGRGKVLSFSRAQGTAHAQGTAYASGTKSKWENAMDWIERLFSKLEHNISLYGLKSENAINLSKQNSYVSTQEKNNEKLIKANEKGAKKYRQAAASVGLSKDLQKKVLNGTIDVQTLSEENKQKVEDYQQMIDKAREAEKAVEELKKQQKELAQTKLDNLVDYYDTITEKLEAQQSIYSAKQKYWQTSGHGNNLQERKNIDEQLKIQKQITKNLQNEQKKYAAEMKKAAKGLGGKKSKEYLQAEKKYNEIKAAVIESQTSEEDLKNQRREIAYTLKQNVIDKFERVADRLSAAADYLSAKGADSSTRIDNYEKQIQNNNDLIYSKRQLQKLKLHRMAALHTEDAEYQTLAEEVASLDKEIINLATDMENLKDKIREVRWEDFNAGITSLDNQKTEIDDIRNLLNQKGLVDTKDGSLTSDGYANILLVAKGMTINNQKIADYREAINKLQEELKHNVITQKEYNEYVNQYETEIRKAASANQDYSESLISMYKDQIKYENEALQDNIKKRKEALKAKEDYYQYDRKIKTQTKDIDNLKAQIAALEGATNAADKARQAKLKEQLSDAQDKLDSDVHSHRVDLITNGYTELSESASEALNDTLDVLEKSTEAQKQCVDNMLKYLERGFASTGDSISNSMSDAAKSMTTGFDVAFTRIGSLLESTAVKLSEILDDAVKAQNLKLQTTPGQSTANESATKTDTSEIPTTNPNTDKMTNDAMNGDHNPVKVSSIGISPSSVTLTEGQSTTAKITVNPDKATNRAVKLVTPVPSNVKASLNGSEKDGYTLTITGVKTTGSGDAVSVTVKSVDSAAKTATIKVKVRTKTAETLSQKAGKGSSNNGKSLVNQTLKEFDYGNFTKEEQLQFAKDYGVKADENTIFTDAVQQQLASKMKTHLEKVTKNKIRSFIDGLPKEDRDAAYVQKNGGIVGKYISQKYNKRISPAEAVQLSKIVGMASYPSDFSQWSSTQKNALIKKLNNFGFSTGGVVKKGRYLEDTELLKTLGAGAFVGGDNGWARVQPGEIIMNDEHIRGVASTIAQNQLLSEQNRLLSNNVQNVAREAQNITNHFGYAVNVQGDLTKDTLPELEVILKKSYDYTTKQFSREAGKRGMR